MTSGPAHPIDIVRLADQPGDPATRQHLLDGIDAIFWATTQRTFDNPADRTPFRSLWLADYLRDDPQHVWLALTPSQHVAGYLVGTLATPTSNPRWAALTYFEAFAPALPDYPAHLHINLDAIYRNQGIGRRLIDAFANQVRAAGLPGFHVVTGADQRNVRFYARAGFTEIIRTSRKSGDVVFLGRKT